MKIERWGVHGHVAPSDVAPGTLVAGVYANTPWLGMIAEDGDGRVVVLFSEFMGEKPTVVDLVQLSGPMHLIDGTVAVEPIDLEVAFRLPRCEGTQAGGLIVGSDGSLGIIATYSQGLRKMPLLYNLETGARWQVRTGDQVMSGWKIQIVLPGRALPIELARFPTVQAGSNAS